MTRTARWLSLIAGALSLLSLPAGAQPIDPYAHAVAYGGFTDVNQDTAALFAQASARSLVLDETIYFGILDSRTRSRDDGPVSGGAAGPSDSGACPPPGSTVPEPSCVGLLAAGLALLGLRTRRS